MSIYELHRERVKAWLGSNGYNPESISRLPSRQGLMSSILDHGFIATHIATGRRVLFGDPYEYGVNLVEQAEQRYGLEIRRYAGLWHENSTLLELWVVDPLKAAYLFRLAFSGIGHMPFAYFYGAPVEIHHVSKFLGVKLSEIKQTLIAQEAREVNETVKRLVASH